MQVLKTKLNQSGFSAVEALLLVAILAILGGVGYYVYHANQQSNTTLTSTSNATQTKVAKADSVISVDTAKLPSGWQAVVNTPSTISVADTAVKCTLLVSQTASPTLTVSGAQAFVNRKLAALTQGNASGDKVTVGTPADQTIGSQTVSMYPVTGTDSKGQATLYSKLGYVVGKGYYVYVNESCPVQANLTQNDAALQAVTIKS